MPVLAAIIESGLRPHARLHAMQDSIDGARGQHATGRGGESHWHWPIENVLTVSRGDLSRLQNKDILYLPVRRGGTILAI